MESDERNGDPDADDDPDNMCPICLVSVVGVGQAVFTGHCGHAVHCECLFREFEYRRNWRCLRCTQAWKPGRFVFLKCADKRPVYFDHIDGNNNLPTRVFDIMKSVGRTSMYMHTMFNVVHIKKFLRSETPTTFSTDMGFYTWDSMPDDLYGLNAAMADVCRSEAPLYWFQYGLLATTLFLAVITKRTSDWFGVVSTVDIVLSQILSSKYFTFKTQTRVAVLIYLVSMLGLMANSQKTTDETQKTAEGVSVVLLSAFGMCQLIASQDEAGVEPTRAMKMERVTHVCTMRIARTCVRFYILFVDDLRRGLIATACAAILASPDLFTWLYVGMQAVYCKLRAVFNRLYL
jgi:hypothetical protein